MTRRPLGSPELLALVPEIARRLAEHAKVADDGKRALIAVVRTLRAEGFDVVGPEYGRDEESIAVDAIVFVLGGFGPERRAAMLARVAMALRIEEE